MGQLAARISHTGAKFQSHEFADLASINDSFQHPSLLGGQSNIKSANRCFASAGSHSTGPVPWTLPFFSCHKWFHGSSFPLIKKVQSCPRILVGNVPILLAKEPLVQVCPEDSVCPVPLRRVVEPEPEAARLSALSHVHREWQSAEECSPLFLLFYRLEPHLQL